MLGQGLHLNCCSLQGGRRQAGQALDCVIAGSGVRRIASTSARHEADNLLAALRVVLAVEGTTCVPEKQLRQPRHPGDAQARETVMCGHRRAGVLRVLGGGCTSEAQGWNPANPVAAKRIPGCATAFRAPSGGRIGDWRKMNRAWLCRAQGCASLCTVQLPRPPCATVAASSASASISGARRLMLSGGWEGEMFDAMCGLAGASKCSA